MATESQILRTSTRFARAKHFYYGFGRYTIKVQIIFHRTRPWLLLLRLLGAASTWGLASNENWCTRVFGYGVLVTSLLAILTPVAARYHVMALITVRIFQGLFLVCIFYYLFCFHQSFRFWSLNKYVNKNHGLSKKSQKRSKSIWLFFFFCVWVALSSKQTQMG